MKVAAFLGIYIGIAYISSTKYNVKIVPKEQEEKLNPEYWKKKSPDERLEAVQILREKWVDKFHHQTLYDGSRKGLLPNGIPSEEDFIKLLNENEVRYLIVGAFAVSFHARVTQVTSIFYSMVLRRISISFSKP